MKDHQNCRHRRVASSTPQKECMAAHSPVVQHLLPLQALMRNGTTETRQNLLPSSPLCSSRSIGSRQAALGDKTHEALLVPGPQTLALETQLQREKHLSQRGTAAPFSARVVSSMASQPRWTCSPGRHFPCRKGRFHPGENRKPTLA